MSEPACANCPKGRALDSGKVECHAHPPAVVAPKGVKITDVGSYEVAQQLEWPTPPAREVCHEHPALEEAERVGIERRMEPAHDDYLAPVRRIYDEAVKKGEYLAQRRDMCEFEEGGKDD